MKKYYSLILIACTTSSLCHAQLYIQNGTNVSSTGHAIITLQHTNLINNGTYSQGTGGITVFNGNGIDSIQGTAQPNFDSLEIAKTGNGMVVLKQFINVNKSLKFTAGLLDLHGKTVYLQGNNSSVTGETESSHATDTVLDGSLWVQQMLNAPNAVNPGNLGAIITSAQNMGTVTVIRRHTGTVTNGGSPVATINRQFEITPFPASYNNNLNATLRFQYLDAELHNQPESNLVLYKSDNSGNAFTNQSFTTRDASANYVEKTGINDFFLFTLTNPSTALPLKLISFAGICEQANVILHWQMADGAEASHFVVEQSEDGLRWNAAGNIAYSDNTNNYTFSDKRNNSSYYRLNIKYPDGKPEYSDVIHVHCDIDNDDLSVYPNPAYNTATLKVITQKASGLQIKVMALNGQLLFSENHQLQPGSQMIPLNLSGIAAGSYIIHAYWGEGKYNKVIKLVKE